MRSETKPSQDEEKTGQEPVLPPRRNTTILVLGADGFGRPISGSSTSARSSSKIAARPSTA